MDTIYALATAHGKSGVAVVRISGDRADSVLLKLIAFLPEPRKASLQKIRHKDGQVIDEALILRFEKGKSFTGESLAELHLHGSPAIVQAVMDVLAKEGLRLAEAGEFTRRALMNNRLDLSQVEGLADLINAETEAQRIQAMRVFSGEIGDKAKYWRSHLVRAAALIEATIDFADEDVPENVTEDVLSLVRDVWVDLCGQIKGSYTSERIRDGFEIAIIGPPNAGKSTLLNYLAGRKAAITSEFAGTTRDVIELRMDLHGLPVTFLDTAGLRETDDAIEKLGIDLARQRAEHADIRVFLQENAVDFFGMTPKEDDIVVQGKADQHLSSGFAISGKTGQGVDRLISVLTERLKNRSSEAALIVNARHREAIKKAANRLEKVLNASDMLQDIAEILAEDLRLAIADLDALIGHVDVEHLLDDIFRNFCIGK